MGARLIVSVVLLFNDQPASTQQQHAVHIVFGGADLADQVTQKTIAQSHLCRGCLVEGRVCTGRHDPQNTGQQ